MENSTGPQRPPLVINLAGALGILAGANLFGGSFLLYNRFFALQPYSLPNEPGLISFLLFNGIVCAFLGNELYNLRPWSFWMMRLMIIAVTQPYMDPAARHEKIDAREIREAFGIEPAGETETNQE